MQTQRTGDGTPSPVLALARSPVVPQRSARRAAARRASDRRASARELKHDIEGGIFDYLEHHPQSTTGDIAKGLNADRGTIAAALSRMARASDVTNDQAAPNDQGAQ
jgi:hypothetical protein